MEGIVRKDRGIIVFAIFMGTFVVLLARLVVVQLVLGDRLRERSATQGRLDIELLPWRGTIYDRNGRELAISISADSIYVRPSEVEEPGEVASKLSQVLGEDRAVIMKKLTSNRPFVWVKRKVEKHQARMIGDISGVGMIEESKRSYPTGRLASHVLGFAGVDNYGLEGIELLYDSYLRGIPGHLRSKKDARGREIAALRYSDAAAHEGEAVTLSIDEIIQRIVERELDRAYSIKPIQDSSKLNVKAVTAIVMKPQTGEILALANLPGFDPGNFGFSSFDEKRNRAVTDVFEPGSCFKVIAAAAALEEKLFEPDEMIFCENGSFRIGGHTIHDVHPYGWLTFKQVVEKSSNIGLSKMGLELGAVRLYSYIRAFGFGEKSGCNLPGEIGGLLRHPRRWSRICNATISFGQGVAVTPMQLITAFSAIANGGILMRPMVVKSVIDKNSVSLKYFEPQEVRRVISKETAMVLTEALVGVVERGTGRRARLAGYQVAGKTGTAQKVDKNGTYSHTRFVSSFVGYVPAWKPEIAILVVVDEPSAKPSQCYGGRVAAPVFQRIAAQTLRYLGVVSQKSGRKFVKIGLGPVEKLSAAAKCSKIITVNGESYYETEARYQSGAYLVIEDGEDIKEVKVSMPDVCGLTMRQVLRILSPYQLEMKFKGSGVATDQNPRPGIEIYPGTKCSVTFRNRT